jgi:GNAT superfamily N-acetyltransferase
VLLRAINNAVKGRGEVSGREWNVREFRDEDVDASAKLFAEVFHQNRPKEHFIWKFHDNPAGRGLIIVAEHSNQIVGQYTLIPTRLRLGNETVLGAISLDTMTHPDYRGQGMFVVLAKACMELAASKRVEVLYTNPNKDSYPWFVHRLNWDHTGDISEWVRVLNPSGLARWMSRPIRYLAPLGLPLLPIGNNVPHGIDIRPEKPTDEELVSLAELKTEGETGKTCRVQRSVDWFKWRFDSKSQRSYVWFSAYCDGKLKAWAAFGTNDWGEMPSIHMFGSDQHALEAVVSSATRRAKQSRVPALVTFTNDKNISHVLKSCGYFRHGSLPLVVRSLTSRTLDGNIHLHSSWRIASEDIDNL